LLLKKIHWCTDDIHPEQLMEARRLNRIARAPAAQFSVHFKLSKLLLVIVTAIFIEKRSRSSCFKNDCARIPPLRARSVVHKHSVHARIRSLSNFLGSLLASRVRVGR
jgi:hypothetical protein